MNFDATYWNNLKIKYQATDSTNDSPILELILSKAELVINLNDFEKNWLKKNHLSATLLMIETGQKEKAKLSVKLQSNFSSLSSKYKTLFSTSWKENDIYVILLKLEREESLSNAETLWLQKQYRTDIQKLAILSQKIDDFCKLKNQYKIVQRPDLSLESSLVSILQKLEVKESLNDKEINYLKKYNLDDALSVFEQQETEKQEIFSKLKEKYQVLNYPDTSISNTLYPLLHKIDI